VLPQELIRTKRDGGVLDGKDIRQFVFDIASGKISPAQVGAFTMAVYLKKMTRDETVAYTLAMRDTGRVADWKPLGLDNRRLIDKHSSGGVGDEKVTLLVVPLAAACGLHVPNLSAGGLGHTGGETDMLAAVPGYDCYPSAEKLQRVVKEVGGIISGATPDLAPVDRIIFDIRDVSGTVESVTLITGSILSKKLSVAPRGLVMSVGCGSGAFMDTREQARELATSLAEVGAGAGVPSVMLVTDLSAVLGVTIGNAIEMIETVDFLTGKFRERRTLDLLLEVVGEMLVMGGVAADMAAAKKLAQSKLDDGSAAETFARLIAAMGGPADYMDNPAKHMEAAPVVKPLFAARAGNVAGMDCRGIGYAAVDLGAGRKTPGGPIDLAVGLSEVVQVGDAVGPDRPLCVLHARSQADWDRCAARLLPSFLVTEEKVAPLGPVVLERVAREP
jgi:thymidine phosphorylase